MILITSKVFSGGGSLPKLAVLLLGLVFFSQVTTVGQSSQKVWTPWTSVEGDWAEFYVFTRFAGGDKRPDELAKKPLNSLKVVCSVVGRVRGSVPPEIKGVKLFRIIYKAYGELTDFDHGKDWIDLYYSEDGSVAAIKEFKRAAAQLDVDEAVQADSTVKVTTTVPTLPGPMVIDPFESSLRGRKHRIGVEWRRKGSTVELKLKDYRP